MCHWGNYLGQTNQYDRVPECIPSHWCVAEPTIVLGVETSSECSEEQPMGVQIECAI